jgi:5-formyltetrahydrofolate cyclo-ligase
MISKQELRVKLRVDLKSLPSGCFYDEGRRAAELIGTFPPWREARQILLFLSLPDEIDTAPLLDLALSRGKEVFAPKIERDRIRFFRIASCHGPWETGPCGIREPADGLAEAGKGATAGPTLIVTPGLAFDRQGRRLGRGKGYYDRFFAALDKDAMGYYALGLCLKCQILPRVPAESLDKTMNAVCTGEELFTIIQN